MAYAWQTSMMVKLRVIDRNNWQEALALTLEPEQRRFVSESDPPAAIPLAKAFIRPSGREVRPLGIYLGSSMIGYLNIVEGIDPADDIWLFHLFIDHAWQGRGYARSAMSALHDFVCQRYPKSSGICLSVNPENFVALHLYASVGFAPTGEIAFGEPVYRLRLDETGTV